MNRYNDLYDPLMGRSVCISGQLYLLELAMHMKQDIEGLRVISANTDGLMVEFDDSQYDQAKAIVDEWQERTGFELEEDPPIIALAQKDVNNYVEVQQGNKVKTKGGYLVRGIAPAGAFNINNNACIVATALKEYLVNGTPPEETIMNCNDISQFQLIAKAGSMYERAFTIVNGEEVPVQRVNRVYATTDTTRDTLYKVKISNGQIAKIGNLPDHCLIDNRNVETIDKVDKQWYIDLAHKRINDFLGVKPEKKTRKRKAEGQVEITLKEDLEMAENKKSVAERLAEVRLKFLEQGVDKSGKNMMLKSLYFTLSDIVPVAMPLFHEARLLPMVNIDNTTATICIADYDDPQQNLIFCAPMREYAGNAGVNPLQAAGASITYMRRYLYLVALDIVEVDDIEEHTAKHAPDRTRVEEAPKPAAVNKPHAPVTEEKREEIKKELTAPDGAASQLQIKQLKTKLKELLAKGGHDKWISKITIDTKSFKNITKTQAENYIIECGKRLEAE